jgi:hypothetical protein
MGVGDPVLLFDFEMGGARDPLTYARLNGTWGFLSGLIRMAPARRRSSLCFEVRCGLRGLGQSRERIRRRGRFAAAGLDVVDGDHPIAGRVWMRRTSESDCTPREWTPLGRMGPDCLPVGLRNKRWTAVFLRTRPA